MKIDILGIKIDAIKKSEAFEKIRVFLRDGEQHFIATPNPEILVLASRDKNFQEILNSADMLVPDGIGLLLASWFLKTPLGERITGVELVHDIAELATREGKSIFLFGGEKGTGEKAAKELQRRIQNTGCRIDWLDGVTIAYSANECPLDGTKSRSARGFVLPRDLIQKINNAKPDILFVALGHGKQERFIARYLAELPSVKVAVGVGGALDFIADKIPRAPKFLQKIGLEWLWRLLIQPWRFWRIITAVIIFPTKVLVWRKLESKQ